MDNTQIEDDNGVARITPVDDIDDLGNNSPSSPDTASPSSHGNASPSRNCSSSANKQGEVETEEPTEDNEEKAEESRSAKRVSPTHSTHLNPEILRNLDAQDAQRYQAQAIALRESDMRANNLAAVVARYQAADHSSGQR